MKTSKSFSDIKSVKKKNVLIIPHKHIYILSKNILLQFSQFLIKSYYLFNLCNLYINTTLYTYYF